MKKRSWLYRLFNDLYIVEVTEENGNKSVYSLQHIKKLSNTVLKGINEEGLAVELNSVKPFSYKVKKLY
jgi:hypothetical protein